MAAMEDIDVQKQITEPLLLKELMVSKVNTLSEVQCNALELDVSSKDYRISTPISLGANMDIVRDTPVMC